MVQTPSKTQNSVSASDDYPADRIHSPWHNLVRLLGGGSPPCLAAIDRASNWSNGVSVHSAARYGGDCRAARRHQRREVRALSLLLDAAHQSIRGRSWPVRRTDLHCAGQARLAFTPLGHVERWRAATTAIPAARRTATSRGVIAMAAFAKSWRPASPSHRANRPEVT